MNGGTISENNGGVYLRGVFNMTGGTIVDNIAGENLSSYGGVYVDIGIFNMTGGKISGNSTTLTPHPLLSLFRGMGVHISSSGRFHVGGTAVVSGNTSSVGGADNVFFSGNHVNSIRIGIGDNVPRFGMNVGINNSGFFTLITTEEQAQYFFADAENMCVVYSSVSTMLALSVVPCYSQTLSRNDGFPFLTAAGN
jgi:hypothetical protein